MSRLRRSPPSTGARLLRPIFKINPGSFVLSIYVCTFILLATLPGVTSSFWQWNSGGAPRKIKPRVTRPSGPMNITLVVVSRSELGVTWEPPQFDGGKAITKYLVEWDTDKYMTSGIASPSNPYENNVDGPLVRSEVVWGETKFRIAGLKEGQQYYVRVSAYGDGYSNAISSNPPYAIPTGTLPGFLTDVSLTVASDSATADRLRLAWSAPALDVNGFSVRPPGCAGGESPPSAPDAITAYRVRWGTHPSLENANVYDIPVVTGDGSPKNCCPSGPSGACNVELGAEVQTVSIKFPSSTVASGGELFDSGGLRIVYLGSQSKSIQVESPMHGSNEVRIASSLNLPTNSPISTGDLIRIQSNVYLVSNVDGWPNSITLSSEYISTKEGTANPESIQAHFTTPPSSCFDVSDLGNSAENLRSHISQNFDNSPFDESITVSRSTLTETFESSESADIRIVGYDYHITFTGQGFSSSVESAVEELMIISKQSSPFSTTGTCGVPFVSNGVDISTQVSLAVSTRMESGSVIPGEKYYVHVAGVNTNGLGPYVPTNPEAEIPRSQPGLAQNCRVFAVPSSSSSLKVEWDGSFPNHGEIPSSYKVELYDVDSNSPEPATSQVIGEIDESSKYSITVDSLIPGTRYKVLIAPVNGLGEGGPNWFTDFNPSGLFNDHRFSKSQDYLEKKCHALPTCASGSVECNEIDRDNYFITARSVPHSPIFDAGTYPSVSNQNRFSDVSVLVTFESPLTNEIGSTGIPTDKFLIEWSTVSSFIPTKEADLLRSAEVSAHYSDGSGEHAIGEYLIESLNMGTEYFVRVSAHNSAGYGRPTIRVPVKPMTRPDPPFELMLSSLSLENIKSSPPENDSSDSSLIGTSLLVSWQHPRIDSNFGRPDRVGDGGDKVSSYLVEWSRISWESYSPTVFEIRIKTWSGTGGSSAAGLLAGSFRILVDTTQSAETAVRGTHISANIPVDSSTALLKTIIENIPNVGEVDVQSPEPFVWLITFMSEVGDIGLSLAENKVVDDNMVAGTVHMTKISAGNVPANSAYGSHIIDTLIEISVDESIHYVIEHLVPGMKVFVRVSAGNKVGFGPRRKTAPEFFSPTIQRPGLPTSLYTEDSLPHLSVHSSTSLQVHIGPPLFDGGSPLTSFFIEWDSSPSFDSSQLGDGSALGSARTDAASLVCNSCVTRFDLLTNTFTYDGSDVMAKLLVPQRKIMIYFEDDNKWYVFSVLSASSSNIIVSSKHLRVSSTENMQGQDGEGGSDLELLGTTFIIDKLDTGRPYFVRVSSENGEMGTGKHIATSPPKKAPLGLPPSPEAASLNIVDKNSLSISWSSHTYLNDPGVQAFKVERFCKSGAASSSSISFFGEEEVVELSTAGLDLLGGTFTVYFGGFDTSTRVFLGTVKVAKGTTYVETQLDMSPYLYRGEEILIGDDQYFVHETDPFTSTRLPLAVAYTGKDAESISVFSRSKSMPIAFDATAAEMQNALEQMPHVNNVKVRREVDDAYSNGYHWFVTFVSNVGPQPELSVDSSYLVGTNPLGFSSTRRVLGVLPDNYETIIIDDPTVTSFTLKNLETGKPYYIRIASISEKGESMPVESSPASLTPGGVPAETPPPTMKSLNENTILASFESAVASNGALIEEYVIDSSTDPSFSSSSRMRVKPDHKIQRVTTRAHTLPWSDTSSFTLSLGDFHGDFTVPIGYGTTVRVHNGGNILERSTGSVSLSSVVARGDYISVGGIEFRVCLDILGSIPYDEASLSLCSKDDALQTAHFHVESTLDIIDELPIFILDTSLGAAKSPSVGDIFLSTVDSSGSSKDTRGRLRRGDLVRIGHPESGETFRVSTDLSRDFTDRVIPLSSNEDSSLPASLSSTSLVHATYEVQSFYIRSSTESVMLSPSNIYSSGFRIRFKSETTHTTTAGGTKGCLTWDGDANDLKLELETLTGIDSVEVTREELQNIPGGTGSGIKYYVTFVGLNVRGNIPPLQIVDVGTNGCLDAHDLGGRFGENIAPITVEQVEIPYVPFYEVQTTVDIPYDAEAADMQAAIESLSQACKVGISRQINRNGFSWDVTFAETRDGLFSPLLVVSANGENLSAVIDPGVSVVGLQQVQVPTTIGGVPYFMRVAAVNSFGMGPFAISNPRAIEVSSQPPSEPIDVFAEVISEGEILVQWNPPLENGGRPITHYKIEYDELLSFTGGKNSGPYGSISISSSSINVISDIQSITVKIDSNGLIGSRYLSGTFSIHFDGQQTNQIPHNASPDKVKAALEDLCNVHGVHVTRSIHCSTDTEIGCMKPDGYSWLVTFVSPYSQGDQHNRPTSKLSSNTSHKLSVDGSYLFECTDVSLTACSIGGSAIANVGTVQEMQMITISSSSFSVHVGGESSAVVDIGDPVEVVEEKLNTYSKNGVGKISVSCPSCTENVIRPGDSILLHFVSFRGDLPAVSVSDPNAIVDEVSKGNSQFVIGRSSYSTIISGLTSVKDWYVRVFAYNGIGGGRPAVAWPSPLRLAVVAPQHPENVSIGIESASSLAVSWDRPSSIGGVELSSFVIEYDTSPSFSTRNGLPLEQLTVSEADADTSIGLVAQAYPGNSDPNLRKRIFLEDANLISEGIITVGSEIVVSGQHIVVSSINAESCGVSCLSLSEDYSGTRTSGMKIYHGLTSKQYSFSIHDLTPGVPYFVRVAATNEKAVGPFAFAGHPFGPVSQAPRGIPASLSWASISPITEDKLRVDFGPPILEKPEGLNGSPMTKYHIEVAAGAVEIQELLISSTTAFQDGAFALAFGGETTSCINIGASAETVAVAIESLSAIDGISAAIATQSDSLLIYTIEFNGPTVASKDHPLLEIDYSAECTQSLDDEIDVKILSVQDGVEAFRPEIATLSTRADSHVYGFMELSVGYRGDYNMLVSIGNQPARFKIDPGSRWVDTMGDDLTSVLHPGEILLIGEEFVEVQALLLDRIELKEYHIRGTNSDAIFGYRMDNYIGSATISPGNNWIAESSGGNLEAMVRPGEVIEVTNDYGNKEYLTVSSVDGSSVYFSPSYGGTSITRTPMYTRKKTIVSANASSAVMRVAIESLPEVGSVAVTRDGPNSSEGFTWNITFLSNMGMSACSRPSWCFSSSVESVTYLTVNGIGQDYDGNYILTSFINGRPRYDLLEKSCYIAYEPDNLEWRLYSSAASVISFATSSDMSVPLSGWSNAATVASPTDSIPLLMGQNAIAEVSILQSDVQQSFENVVFSVDIENEHQEIQEIEILCDKNDLAGSFELSLGDMSDKVVVYFDDSNEDLVTKLQSLSGIGRVSVEHTSSPTNYGIVWSITFHSNSGDVPLLRHHGTSNIEGSFVSFNIREKVKGNTGQNHVIFDNLENGRVYSARIRVENEVGAGPYTTSSQIVGGGFQPMACSLSTPPGPPALTAGVVTKSEAEIKFTQPSSNGSDILSYRFEWTTSNTFGVPTKANARVFCSDGSEIFGNFRFIYGSENPSRSEVTAPIDIRSGSVEISLALNALKLLNRVEISTDIDSASELEWTISIMYDIGHVGPLSMDTNNLRCQSEELPVESTVTMTTFGSMPTDYGSAEIFTDERLCGSVYLGEFSSMQHFTLTAQSGPVTSGSFQIMFDGQSSECIPFDATELQVKTAIKGFVNIDDVDVIATTTPVGSPFPYVYDIVFKGSYAYGDWPALQVNPSNFGAGSCEPFVGGIDHNAVILPIRDESLCSNGTSRQFAIVIDSHTSVGGTFSIHYGQQSSGQVSINASPTEMEEILAELLGSTAVKVNRHSHNSMDVGIAWAVSFLSTTSKGDEISIDDTLVTGKNAKVNVYPILSVYTYSPQNDSRGDFRIVIDGETTSPLSHQATQNKVMQEIHLLEGIGKVNMLGPIEGGELPSLELDALIEDSFTVRGLKAVAVIGDLTSTIARGDRLVIGTCDSLQVNDIFYEEFDEYQSAGYLYKVLYPSSLETARADTFGYSLLLIEPTEIVPSFASDCSQSDGVNERVFVGSVFYNNYGVDHSMIIKSHTSDLDNVSITPESNWRGSAPRIFFKKPAGSAPQTFIMNDMDKDKTYIVRASAKNSEGYGPPSNALALTPAATVPSVPTNVVLF